MSLLDFPDTIVRRRQEPGRYVLGEWVPGAVTETTFAASVQPLNLEDTDFAGGALAEDRRKIYVPAEGALLAAFGNREADKVVIDGVEFIVDESQSWRDHTKAVLTREV